MYDPDLTIAGYSLSAHARHRLSQREFTEAELTEALVWPQVSYPALGTRSHPEPRQIREGHRVRAVVDPGSRTVITVLFCTASDWPVRNCQAGAA